MEEPGDQRRNQTFHGPVGQVAGRDVVTVVMQVFVLLAGAEPPARPDAPQPETLPQLDSEELRAERDYCRGKRWELLRTLYLATGIVLLIMGSVIVWMFSNLGQIFLGQVLQGPWFWVGLAAIVAPHIWLGRLRRKYGPRIDAYSWRIRYIDDILLHRSL